MFPFVPFLLIAYVGMLLGEKKSMRASYTRGSCAYFAGALFLIPHFIRTGISMYTEVKEAACHYEQVQQFDAASEIKQIKRWKKLLEE